MNNEKIEDRVMINKKEQQYLSTSSYVDKNNFAKDVMIGLSEDNKHIDSKYFYDYFGSNLFEQICVQPEYYPTRVEFDIIRENTDMIQQCLGINEPINIIELGSGSSKKTRKILEHYLSFQKKLNYLPIDISKNILVETTERLSTELSNLNVHFINEEYHEGIKNAKRYLKLLSNDHYKNLILFLGSSIGNFEFFDASIFLKKIRNEMNKDDFILIGFDLQKDKEILENAYNDKSQITSKFNLNLLFRINRELDGEFNLDDFSHFAFYNQDYKRIEMHLVSNKNQNIKINHINKTFQFKENEKIHTENSYKYNKKMIQQLANLSGLQIIKEFTDKDNLFSLVLFN